MDDRQSPSLSAEAANAAATVCLMAAFADGQMDRTEKAWLEEIFETLGGVELGALYQRVMLELSDVRALFQNQLEQGRVLFERYQGDVQEKASTTNLQSLMKLVR